MNEKELLQKLDSVISEANLQLIEAVKQLEGDVYDSLISELSKFKLNKDGSVKASVENLKTLSRINTQIDKITQNENYSTAVNNYVSNFDKIKDINNAYFSTVSNAFTETTFMNELKNIAIQESTESLIGATAFTNMEVPIKQALNNLVINGSGLNDIKETLKKIIVSTDNIDSRAVRYVSQMANDSMFQFSANYQNIVSDDLDLQYYLYEGAEQSTTRCFCHERRGKYYSKKEVQEWGGNPNLWLSCKTKRFKGGGMIPGTNKTTIFTYRGGYNCKHLLIPVSEMVAKRTSI